MTRSFVALILSLCGALVAPQPAAALPPDPSTFTEFTCSASQTLVYADATYGDITGKVFRPYNGNCLAVGATPADRPVALFFNGAGYDHNDYDYVARHLTRNGWVVAVVFADEPAPDIACAADPGPVCIEDRARKGVAFLRELQSQWVHSALVEWDNVSVLGHSRGGEAAVEASHLIRWEEVRLGNPGVRAVVSLAPTDLGTGVGGRRRVLGRDSAAFLVVYGSRDEQLKGLSAPLLPALLPAATGFALYDRTGREGSLEGFPISLDDQVDKAMAFVERANHEQFSDQCGTPVCWPSVLACATQQTVGKGLTNAFLRWHVLGEGDYKQYFDGTITNPWGVAVWPQLSYGAWGSRRVIDDFQDGEVPTGSLGGALSVNGDLTATVVDNTTVDFHFLGGPEDGSRLEVSAPNASASNILQWTIPAASQNASGFTHLSFRIGQAYGSVGDVRVSVRLRRGNTWSSVLSSNTYGAIPDPDAFTAGFCGNPAGFYSDTTISHLRTIRIPLSAFGGNLAQLQNVQLRFDHASTAGKTLYLDNLELTGGSGQVELP